MTDISTPDFESLKDSRVRINGYSMNIQTYLDQIDHYRPDTKVLDEKLIQCLEQINTVISSAKI
jgi:hypothetical protein